MIDGLPETVLHSLLLELDLYTLASVEATCTSLKKSVRSLAITGAVITSPSSSCFASPANTIHFRKFVTWLKEHAPQFRSVTVAEDDPEAAGAIGIALGRARNLTSLVTSTPTTSGWKVPSCMMYACCEWDLPRVETLLLGRGSTSPQFLQAYSKTLRSLAITVSSTLQLRETLDLCLPEVVDLRLTATCVMPCEGTRGIFRKLRYLTVCNLDFRSSLFQEGPPELESLMMIGCRNVQNTELPQIPINVHLGIHGMIFPDGMDVRHLQELSIHHLSNRVPSMAFPHLRRFHASYSDISMNIAFVPKIWAVTIGQQCTGDKSWLLKVPTVFL